MSWAVPRSVGPDTVALQLREVSKRYGETHALAGLSLEVRRGEIFGIAGPNGAGKSTMIKILAEEESEDSGSITLDGREWDASVARRDDVAVVHQEPLLYPNLSVGENLLLGKAATGLGRPRLGPRERELLEELGISKYADTALEDCSLIVWQLTEIARALLKDAKVFLFDEPNSALTDRESEQLFEHLLRLRDAGDVVVILVSHRLAELARYSDRVAVIRDGRCSLVLEAEQVSAEAVARGLVGGEAALVEVERPAKSDVRRDEGPDAPPLLELKDWTDPEGMFAIPSFRLVAGTVVALTGVEGSGARELLRSIAGVEKCDGSMKISSASNRPGSEKQYVAGDRAISLFTNFSVGANLVSRLGRGHIASRIGTIQPNKTAALTLQLAQAYQVKAASPRVPISALSGGNQQKVAVAAAMATQPQLLLIEEPTRGVDARTKAEIYHLLQSWAASGNAVLVFCTEVPEVMDLADVVYVMSRGRLSDPVHVEEFDDVPHLAATLTDIESRGSHESVVAAANHGSDAENRSAVENQKDGL